MSKILTDFQDGIHTYEISQPLTKKQFLAVYAQMHAKGRLIHNKKGGGSCESYVLLDKEMPGIMVTLYRLRQSRTYRVSIKIEPCRVLGSDDDPTELYQYSWKSYGKLQKRCDRYLEELCVPGGIDDMQICRCDLTCNLVLDGQEYVDAYLRILKKSCLIPGYKADAFKVHERKAKNPQQANQHSHCIRCKQASLLCYDKIGQLKMIGRCPDKLEDAAILRLEAQLTRPALKRTLGKKALWYNGALLKEASNEAVSVIQSYLNKMFPCNGIHLRYKDAMSAVRRVKKKEQRERMLYLLRKASDAATLDSAAQKVKDHYTDVNSKKRKKIYANFDKQGINPITLPNNSHIEKIPSLNTLFRK